jgi:hypothetical protein
MGLNRRGGWGSERSVSCVGEALSHSPLAEPTGRSHPLALRAAAWRGRGKALTGHPPGFEHGYEVHHHPAEPVNKLATGLPANAFGP